MSLRFHDEARQDFHGAAAWYERASPELGADLVQKVKASVNTILTEQRRRPKDGVHTRRLNRFPYRIVYFVRGEDITIVPVMHLHRDPNYWKARLRDL
jgi:plasmid stabilization system protein ParE